MGFRRFRTVSMVQRVACAASRGAAGKGGWSRGCQDLRTEVDACVDSLPRYGWMCIFDQVLDILDILVYHEEDLHTG